MADIGKALLLVISFFVIGLGCEYWSPLTFVGIAGVIVDFVWWLED